MPVRIGFTATMWPKFEEAVTPTDPVVQTDYPCGFVVPKRLQPIMPERTKDYTCPQKKSFRITTRRK